MKHILYILTAVLCLGITACQRHTAYPPAMQQAEALMNTRPDSALLLLKSMADTLTMLPEEARMYHHLLTIQAKDKQYITHTGDSLINRIVAFYEESDDKDRLMMAYYYQGRVYRDMNDAPRALKAFRQAEKVKSPNIDLLTKVYSQMGYLFTYQGLYDEVIRVNKISINLFQSLKQENKAYFAYRDIARAYEAKEMKDSALFYYDKCYQTALANKDSVKLQNILGEQGRLYYNLGQADKAKGILTHLLYHSKQKDKSHINLTLGYIYSEQKLWDSAHFHFHQVLLSDNNYKQYYSHQNLVDIECAKGNYLQASRHAKEALAIKDEIDKVIQTEAVAKINSLYNYQHIEEENLELKLAEKQSDIVILILFSAVLILFVLFLLLLVRHQSMQERFRANKQKVEDLQEQTSDVILENQKKIDEIETNLKNDIEEKAEPEIQMVSMQLQQLKLRNQEIQLTIEQQKLALQTLKHTDVYKLFRRASLGESTKISDRHWVELQTEIKKVYPNFILHIKELYPKATNVEARICILSKLGMPQAHIANVMGYTRGGISLACERFHKKVFGIKCTAKEFAHFIEKI